MLRVKGGLLRLTCYSPLSSMGDFKKLRVWQEARVLTKGVFGAAAKIRGGTGHVLRDQICRAALSIPANIAEGSAKSGDREFARFLKIARGSLAELESHLLIAGDLGVINESDQEPLIAKLGEVLAMLNALLERVMLGAEISERSKRRTRRGSIRPDFAPSG